MLKSHLLILFLKKFSFSCNAHFIFSLDSWREFSSAPLRASWIDDWCIEYLAGRSWRVTSHEMRKPIRTRHKFYHRQAVPLAPFLPAAATHTLQPGGLFGRPLLNLRPINQTIPYKFVTREIARIPRRAARLFLSLRPTPAGNFPRNLVSNPTPSLSSARVYHRFRAHF